MYVGPPAARTAAATHAHRSGSASSSGRSGARSARRVRTSSAAVSTAGPSNGKTPASGPAPRTRASATCSSMPAAPSGPSPEAGGPTISGPILEPDCPSAAGTGCGEPGEPPATHPTNPASAWRPWDLCGPLTDSTYGPPTGAVSQPRSMAAIVAAANRSNAGPTASAEGTTGIGRGSPASGSSPLADSPTGRSDGPSGAARRSASVVSCSATGRGPKSRCPSSLMGPWNAVLDVCRSLSFKSLKDSGASVSRWWEISDVSLGPP